MARQETQTKIKSLESKLTAANDVSSINAVVAKTTKDLLDTTQGVHMTQAYKDQLATIASKLDEKKKVLEEKRKQLTEENAKLTAANATLVTNIASNITQFDLDLSELTATGLVLSKLPVDFTDLGLSNLLPFRAVAYNSAIHDVIY